MVLEAHMSISARRGKHKVTPQFQWEMCFYFTQTWEEWYSHIPPFKYRPCAVDLQGNRPNIAAFPGSTRKKWPVVPSVLPASNKGSSWPRIFSRVSHFGIFLSCIWISSYFSTISKHLFVTEAELFHFLLKASDFTFTLVIQIVRRSGNRDFCTHEILLSQSLHLLQAFQCKF